MIMGFQGLLGLNNYFWGNNNSYLPSYGSTNSIFTFNYIPIENFKYMPFMPIPGVGLFSFNVGTFGGTNTASVNSDKTVLDEIVKMKYDDSDLKEKLDKLGDAKKISSYISGNGHKLAQTINAGDGGELCIYEDADGNSVGSINKDADGKIRNITIDLADGGRISLNTDSDGKIKNSIAMSANNETANNIGVKYENVLKSILENNKGYTKDVLKSDDGSKSIIYMKNGKKIVTVDMDKNNKITSLVEEQNNGKETKKTIYEDRNKNGKIDKDEGFERNDIVV